MLTTPSWNTFTISILLCLNVNMCLLMLWHLHYLFVDAVYIYIIYLYNFLHHLSSFSQRFSCIIGPNGSGKSNVIDSMLFVFGYRAQKIRSKKLSVLIHSSDKHKDVQSCTVEVHFQKIIDKVYMYLSIYQSHRYLLHTLWPLLN